MREEITLEEYRARYGRPQGTQEAPGAAKRARRTKDTAAGSEQALMAAIIEHLQWRGCVVVRVNSGAIPIENGDGTRRFIRMAAAGTSDILACLPSGQFAAIETKWGRGMTTPAQEAFLASVRAAGGVAIVARSIDDVETMLQEQGV
jgi:hypothetical protein